MILAYGPFSFPLFRVALFLGVLFMGVGGGGQSVSAAVGDIFTVTDVEVDETASAANLARGKALAEGQKRAFLILLDRLILSSDYDNLPDLEDSEIAEYVQGIEVKDEKTSSVRYLAKITYRFKPSQIRRFLRDRGIPFSETASKPVLVIPVYQFAGAQLLWDDPNPWRLAWAARDDEGFPVPLKVPLGDLTDIAAIGSLQAMAADKSKLNAIAQRYGAADTLVTVATLNMDPLQNRPALDVSVSRFGASSREYTHVFSFVGETGETVDQLLLFAANEVARQVEEDWKRDNIVAFDRRPESLQVSIPFKDMRQWIDIRNRLKAVPIIRETEVLSLSRNGARVDLRYLGDSDQLRLALTQSDLELRKGDITWELVPIGTVKEKP